MLAWAEVHARELEDKRNRAREGTTLVPIEPLQRSTLSRYQRRGALRLTFADGTNGEVDVLDRMRSPVFERARTPAGFAEVAVDPETATVCWPGEADLAPDMLYARMRTGARPEESQAAPPVREVLMDLNGHHSNPPAPLEGWLNDASGDAAGGPEQSRTCGARGGAIGAAHPHPGRIVDAISQC